MLLVLSRIAQVELSTIALFVRCVLKGRSDTPLESGRVRCWVDVRFEFTKVLRAPHEVRVVGLDRLKAKVRRYGGYLH